MFRAGNVPKKEVPRKICALKRCVNLTNRIFVARCIEMQLSIKHTAQAVSTRIALHSATLRCTLAGNGLLRLATVSSFLARICQTQKPTKIMKKSEKTRQGLYNVGFIRRRRVGIPLRAATPASCSQGLSVNRRSWG